MIRGRLFEYFRDKATKDNIVMLHTTKKGSSGTSILLTTAFGNEFKAKRHNKTFCSKRKLAFK